MLHLNINKTELRKFANLLRGENIVCGNEVKLSNIVDFEKTHGINLPLDLSFFLQNINGMKDTELFKLSRLWPLEEYLGIKNYFNPSLISVIPYHGEVKIGQQLIANTQKWVLHNYDRYFLFGDYNVNGSYWAIELRLGAYINTNIICINDISNTYLHVADSFTEFIIKFELDSPESLL